MNVLEKGIFGKFCLRILEFQLVFYSDLYPLVYTCTIDSHLTVRSLMRSDRHDGQVFIGLNLFSVKAISKAITNAVRPPFRTTDILLLLWQNGKFTLVTAVNIKILSISVCRIIVKTFYHVYLFMI